MISFSKKLKKKTPYDKRELGNTKILFLETVQYF